MFLFEAKRCWRGKGTKAAVLFTVLLVLGHFLAFCIWYIGHQKGGVLSRENQFILKHGLDSFMVYPETVYEGFLGGEKYTFFNPLYYYMIPILAALPFSNSLLQDEESGYYQHICTKRSKGEYYRWKYLITFLSGGLAAGLPYVGSFLVNALYLPAVTPSPVGQHTSIIDAMPLSEYYYSQPWIFYGVYLGAIMLAGSFLAVFALLVSYFSRNLLFVLFSPFLLYLIWDYIAVECDAEYYSIHFMINPLQHIAGANVSVGLVYGVLIALNVLLAVLFLVIGRFREKII